MAAATKYVRSRPGCTLLCLDGGGVKGVSCLMVLKKIMEKVKEIENKETGEPREEERLPKDYFDLAGGTSTGGLAALMLFRLGMSTTQTINRYEKLASKVFAPTIGGFEVHKLPFGYTLGNAYLWVKKLVKGASFSANRLEGAIDDVLTNPALGVFQGTGDTLLRNDAAGRVLMCATLAEKGETVLFRSYKPPAESNPQSETAKMINHDTITIKQACRATSAAPTYLPEMTIQGIGFWDGGLLNNNPVNQVWDARYDLPEARGLDDQGNETFIEPTVTCVVSIGTSYYPQIQKALAKDFVGTVLRTLGFATNTEAKHWDFMGNNIRRNARLPEAARTRYFRYNAKASKNINLDDYQRMTLLEDDTKTYLDNFDKNLNADGNAMSAEELDNHINECARQLAKTKIETKVEPNGSAH